MAFGLAQGENGATQGSIIETSANRISGAAKTVLGPAHVGADEATIKAYIESQKWDEDDQGFKITAPAEP